MAGDWLKWDSGLAQKPEVQAIAERLNLDRWSVAGRLMEIWEWADQHTTSGHARGVTKTFLDARAGIAGMSDAMVAVGWLIIEDGVKFPNFDLHNGNPAKTRAQALHRKRRSRKCHADGVTEASPDASLDSISISTVVNSDTGGVGGRAKKPRTEVQVERDALWDAIVAEWALPTATASQQSRVGKLVAEFKGCKADPAEIPKRRKRVLAEWGAGKDTPESVAKHWGQFPPEEELGAEFLRKFGGQG